MTPASVQDSEITVCAVVGDVAMLDGQRRAPERVERVAEDGIGAAVVRAAATGATWLWLLDGSVEPAANALEELLAPLTRAPALGDPILLSSMIVTQDGELDTRAPPWPRLFWRENAIVGAEHRLPALRAASWGSLLVHRRALSLYGAPRVDFAGAGDDLEWTGRMLRETPGYLVPGSVAVRNRPLSTRGVAYTRSRVRILVGDGWHGTDRVWFAFVLVRDVTGRLAARPSAALRRLRAATAGIRGGS